MTQFGAPSRLTPARTGDNPASLGEVLALGVGVVVAGVAGCPLFDRTFGRGRGLVLSSPFSSVLPSAPVLSISAVVLERSAPVKGADGESRARVPSWALGGDPPGEVVSDAGWGTGWGTSDEGTSDVCVPDADGPSGLALGWDVLGEDALGVSDGNVEGAPDGAGGMPDDNAGGSPDEDGPSGNGAGGAPDNGAGGAPDNEAGGALDEDVVGAPDEVGGTPDEAALSDGELGVDVPRGKGALADGEASNGCMPSGVASGAGKPDEGATSETGLLDGAALFGVAPDVGSPEEAGSPDGVAVSVAVSDEVLLRAERRSGPGFSVDFCTFWGLVASRLTASMASCRPTSPSSSLFRWMLLTRPISYSEQWRCDHRKLCRPSSPSFSRYR